MVSFSKRQQRELENQVRLRLYEEQFERKNAEKPWWRNPALLVPAVVGVIAAAMVSPLFLRQENLGVAAAWDYSSFASTSTQTMPRVGDPFDYLDMKSRGTHAFTEGRILVSLTAEKDRNFTITNVEVAHNDTEALKEASWYFVPPAGAGGGPSIHNVELSLNLDTGAWTNLDPAAQPKSGTKFDPFILTSENPATIRVWVKGTKNQSFSIKVTYQTGGRSEFQDETAGEYVLYGHDASVPHFTVDENNLVLRDPALP